MTSSIPFVGHPIYLIEGNSPSSSSKEKQCRLLEETFLESATVVGTNSSGLLARPLLPDALLAVTPTDGICHGTSCFIARQPVRSTSRDAMVDGSAWCCAHCAVPAPSWPFGKMGSPVAIAEIFGGWLHLLFDTNIDVLPVSHDNGQWTDHFNSSIATFRTSLLPTAHCLGFPKCSSSTTSKTVKTSTNAAFSLLAAALSPRMTATSASPP
jgi:hypothetical protein